MRAVVVGAGVAGLTLAGRLAVHGWQVTIAERAPAPHEQGYMVDFFGPGFDAAEATGVLPRLRELGHRVHEVSYVDPRRGRRRAGLDYDGFARAVDGRLLSLMRPDLERALHEHLPTGVDLRHGCTVADIEPHPDGVRATLSDGTVVEADLLVGADGIHSAVRRAMFGDEQRFSRYLGFHTAAWVFDDAVVRRRIGSRFALTDTVDRQMGLYALRNGRVAAFAVHREPDPRLPADTRAALRSTYAGFGWAVPRALERCPPPSALYYDRVAQVEVPQWHRGRVVLVGDACQAVSLLAGQGASLAVAGAYVLGERLAAAESVEAALAGYERVWRPVVEAKQEVGRRAARWFLPSSTARLLMRRALLHLAVLPSGRRLIGRGLVGTPDPPLAMLVR